MKVHDSARKHGVDPDDAVYAAEHALFVSGLSEVSPARQLRLGFDRGGRLLEVVVLRFDSGNELVGLVNSDADFQSRPRALMAGERLSSSGRR